MTTEELKRAVDWGYCPECGNIEFVRGEWREENKEHVCTNCGQSWFDDVDYTSTVRGYLSERKALSARCEALEERLKDAVNVLSANGDGNE